MTEGLPTQALRLNLGAGDTDVPGFVAVDRKRGGEVFPLAFAAASVDEIRASHVLEHFSHRETGAVLADWVRALKPGGVLKIAVPDFEKIAEQYLAGVNLPIQGYVMGGHVDSDDHHGAVFDAEALAEAMRAAGLYNIRAWQSEIADCASLPISLNLQGRKPVALPRWKVGAAMSVPRLGFMDNFFCAFSALPALGIELRKHTGAFWGQCLERCIDEWLAEGCDWILTLDYDTVFDRATVETLLQLAVLHPEADAIAPIQAGRHRDGPLMTIRGAGGRNKEELALADLRGDLLRVNTAHFGLTLLRCAAIRDLPRPLFRGLPGKDGRWGDDRTDDDIHFWRQWERAGKSLYLACHAVIGHAELMALWPGRDFKPVYQSVSAYQHAGPPEGIWT